MPEYCRRGPLTSFFLRAGLSICETFCLWWLVFMRDPDAAGRTSDMDDGGWMPMVEKQVRDDDGGGVSIRYFSRYEKAARRTERETLPVNSIRLLRFAEISTRRRDSLFVSRRACYRNTWPYKVCRVKEFRIFNVIYRYYQF